VSGLFPEGGAGVDGEDAVSGAEEGVEGAAEDESGAGLAGVGREADVVFSVDAGVEVVAGVPDAGFDVEPVLPEPLSTEGGLASEMVLGRVTGSARGYFVLAG